MAMSSLGSKPEEEIQTLKTSLDKQQTEVDVLKKQNTTLTKEVESLHETLHARYLSAQTKEEEIRTAILDIMPY